MCHYFKNCKQRVVISSSPSTTETVVAGVLQGSTDGPLLFNILIKDLVLFIQYGILGNYADDINISISGSNKENLKKLLLSDFSTLTE